MTLLYIGSLLYMVKPHHRIQEAGPKLSSSFFQAKPEVNPIAKVT